VIRLAQWGWITSLLGLPNRVDISQRGVVNSLAVQMSCGVLGGICKVENGVLQSASTIDMAQHSLTAMGMTLLDPALPDGLLSTTSVARTIPHGFNSVDDFQAFGSTLKGGLTQAGYEDVTAAFQGSSATGVKFTTGQPFDVGRVSDFDIALASRTLLAKAKELDIPLRAGGLRTGPLRPEDLKLLGLSDLAAQLSQAAGRPVNFMIFDTIQTAINKGPSILVPKLDFIQMKRQGKLRQLSTRRIADAHLARRLS
jgi:hypothetical protein